MAAGDSPFFVDYVPRREDILHTFSFWENKPKVSEFWKFQIRQPILHQKLDVMVGIIGGVAVSIWFPAGSVARKSAFSFEEAFICIIDVPAGILQ